MDRTRRLTSIRPPLRLPVPVADRAAGSRAGDAQGSGRRAPSLVSGSAPVLAATPARRLWEAADVDRLVRLGAQTGSPRSGRSGWQARSPSAHGRPAGCRAHFGLSYCLWQDQGRAPSAAPSGAEIEAPAGPALLHSYPSPRPRSFSPPMAVPVFLNPRHSRAHRRAARLRRSIRAERRQRCGLGDRLPARDTRLPWEDSHPHGTSSVPRTLPTAGTANR